MKIARARCFHDIGIQALLDDAAGWAFVLLVGGGLGRTPILGHAIREWLEPAHVLTYFEAILRVYNRHGRRDNMYKARIKILVKERGLENFRNEVEAEWAHLKDGPGTLTQAEIDRVAAHFIDPEYQALPAVDAGFEAARRAHPAFDRG